MTPSLDEECRRVVRRLESLPLPDLEAAAPLVVSACERIIALQRPVSSRNETVFHPPIEALPSALAAVVFDASQAGASDDDTARELVTLRHSLG